MSYNWVKFCTLVLGMHFFSSVHGNTIETLALSGDSVPGLGSEVIFSAIGGVTMNDSAETVFFGRLSGPGRHSANNVGLYRKDPAGVPTTVALAGSAIQNGGNLPIGSTLHGYALNSTGKVVAFTRVTTIDPPELGSHNNEGIISEGGEEGLRLIARKGDVAPGTGVGVTFDRFFGRALLNDLDQTVFVSSLSGPGINSALWGAIYREKADAGLRLIAATNAAAPGVGSNVSFEGLGIPILNSVGQIVFHSSVAGTGIDDSNDNTIYSSDKGGLRLVVQEGNLAPGVAGEVSIEQIGTIVLNNLGEIAFLSSLGGTGIDENNDEVLYLLEGQNGPRIIVQEGDAAPGLDPGVSLDTFVDPVLNNVGQFVFRSTLDGVDVDDTNGNAIYKEESVGKLSLVARSGSSAPGVNDSANFDFRGGFKSKHTLNDAGQVAFSMHLSGPNVDSSNDFGIFAEDRTGRLRLIVREGDLIDVNNDPLIEDFREVKSISFEVRKNDGRPSGFNSNGQLAFWARFTDGSTGAFISNVATVPEPNSLGFLLTFLLVKLFHRSDRLLS